MRTLITGGVKSGKSRHALSIALEFPSPRHFLATAEAFDEEMRDKIRRHQDERAGQFITIEEPLALQPALRERMILDCIPLWLNNMFHYGKESEIDVAIEGLIAALPCDIVIVTNEIGMGFVPADALSRRYGNILGRVNARLAAACDRVILMVSGIALTIKSPTGP